MKTILRLLPDVSCRITIASNEALDIPHGKTLRSSDATLLLGYLIETHPFLLQTGPVSEHGGHRL